MQSMWLVINASLSNVLCSDEFAVAWMNLGIVKATLNKTEVAKITLHKYIVQGVII